MNGLIQELEPDLVAWRRHLHANPELSFEERETADFVVARLVSFGLKPERVAGTGVVARLSGNGFGPVIAVRADLDALPITEQSGADYASRNPGVMHACGHDAHTAILLGVARTLSLMSESWPGEVRLIFQPAEEKLPGGAQAMIAAGAVEGVATIFGLHVWSDLPVGKAGLCDGPAMAAADEFQIIVRGKGGHASQPHQGVDAVVVAAQLVLNLQTIVSRRVDPRRPAVISVGMVKAGYAFNVLAPEAVLTGTTRAFDAATRETLRREIGTVVRYTCVMAGAEGEVDFFGAYPPVINHPDATATLRAAAERVLGAGAVVRYEPVMGGEDFAYFVERIPGSYIFLGAANPERGMDHPHHHPRFDIDERVLPLGVAILCEAVLAGVGADYGEGGGATTGEAGVGEGGGVGG